jgi:hypothetical protein
VLRRHGLDLFKMPVLMLVDRFQDVQPIADGLGQLIRKG